MGRARHPFRLTLSLAIVGVLAACSASPTPDAAPTAPQPGAGSTTSTGPSATHPSPAGSAPAHDEPAAIGAWEPTGLTEAAGTPIDHVTDVLVTRDGRIVVGFYRDERATIATADLEDLDWSLDDPPGARQVRDLIEIDGVLLATGTADPGSPILWRNDGTGWTGVGIPVVPNRQAVNGWDLELLGDGSVLVATDSLGNDPAVSNPGVYRSNDGGLTWEPSGSFPGLGVLALTTTADGTVLAATEESAEHDDADLAGQAYVYRSEDGGRTWGAPVALPGSNRVYALTTLSDGTVWAGTGLRGEILASSDGGRSWATLTHIPAGTRRGGGGVDAREATVEATRVYGILELADGRVVVGTGNQAGDVFVTGDRGTTWETTPDTGPNNVAWGLAQDPDGRLWVGTGSSRGDLLTTRSLS